MVHKRETRPEGCGSGRAVSIAGGSGSDYGSLSFEQRQRGETQQHVIPPRRHESKADYNARVL